MSVESSRSTSEEDVNHARDALKVLKLEMQILGTALTTIYESHSKGLISESERDRLLEKYKVNLTSLEKSIEENQRIVDLFDLESAREELVKDFKSRLNEIDAQVKTLKSGGSLNHAQKTGQDDKKGSAERSEGSKNPTSQEQPPKKASESEQKQITDAEKRVEQIRAEILQAMDRLEQIESEG
jgi:tetrahydromethanopterin S-methyltransferase subunit G